MTFLRATFDPAYASDTPARATRTGFARRHKDFEITVIRNRDGVEAIAAAWLALEAQSSGAVLFQSVAWARAVFDFEARRKAGDFDPVIVTFRQQGQLQAILPLQRVRAAFRRVLVPLGDSFQQYADVLAAPDLDIATALPQMLKAAVAAAPADLVSFLKVRDDSRLKTELAQRAIVTTSGQGAPFVTLAQWSGFDDYFQTIKPKTRKNMRNARNRLERDGALHHRIAETSAEKLGVVVRTLEGRAGRLKDQGITSRAFATSAFADFCETLTHKDTGLELLAMSLIHDGEPMAEQWGFVHGGRYYAYVASRDFSQSDESPGKLHLRDVIETCFAKGLATADLLVPVMPYKLTFAKQVMAVTDYALPVTLKGDLIIRVWDRRLRPLAKRVVLAMPVRLRAALMRLAGRG